jgi:hypothetical protein
MHYVTDTALQNVLEPTNVFIWLGTFNIVRPYICFWNIRIFFVTIQMFHNYLNFLDKNHQHIKMIFKANLIRKKLMILYQEIIHIP